MKVLLSAYIGSHNLGDEAIAEVVIEQLSANPNIQLTVLSHDPAKTSRYAKATNIHIAKSGAASFRQQLRHCDYLIMGGGGIIQDQSSLLNLVYYYKQVLSARRHGKPVIWFFVGVGPITTTVGKRLMRQMASKISHAVVRDPESRDLLLSFGFNAENITTAYDIVFNFPAAAKATAANQDYLLFCPRDWFFVAKILPARYALQQAKRRSSSPLYTYRRRLAEVTEKLLKNDPELTIKAAPFFFTQDHDLNIWLKEQLPNDLSPRFQVIDKELTAQDFVSLAKNAKAVLGIRLHSLILGAVVQRPLSALIYTAKVDSLIKYLGLQAYASHMATPDLAVDEIVKKAQAAMADQQVSYTKKLAHIQQTNRQAVEKTIMLMKELAKET